MNAKIFLGIAFFACAVVAGAYAGGRSLSGNIWFAHTSTGSSNRVPAAIGNEIDFSRLDGSELLTATQKRLASVARIQTNEEGVAGIVLGHFATRAENGERQLACDTQYNRLTLVFGAEGMSDSGEKPTMTVDAPCKTAESDISTIDPILVPYDKILKEKPTNMDLAYEGDVKFKFESMGTEWPLHWGLESIHLYNSDDSTHDIKISNTELHDIRDSALIMNWQDPARVPAEYRR